MTLPTDAAARKAVPLWRGVHEFFPAALAGVARVTVAGSKQHHGGDEIFDDRSKSNDDADCLLRHLEDAFTGDGMDGDIPHIDKVAWRALRLSQKWHEQHGAPLARGARAGGFEGFEQVFCMPPGTCAAVAAHVGIPVESAYLDSFGPNPVRQDTGD